MYPLMYYNHNVHFQSAAAAMAGRHAEAKKAADVLFADALPGVVHDPMVEGFLLQPTFVALRFQKWDDIRKMEDPGPKLPLAARGVALRARDGGRGREGPRTSRRALRERLRDRPRCDPGEPDGEGRRTRRRRRSPSPPRCSMRESPRPRATARRRWRAGRRPSRPKTRSPTTSRRPGTTRCASRSARRSCATADAADAERVFRADLERNPRNPRSLLGLAESLKAQGKSADAAWARAQFDAAAKDADVPLRIEDL